MIRYQNPLTKKVSFIRSVRGDATISVILAIILISGVFLTGGILPHMEDETLKKDTTSVVQGIKSEDASGNSFIASTTTGSDTKRSIQMKQLVLITATPTPTGTPIPTPTRTPTPTPTRTPTPMPGSTTLEIWDITFSFLGCNIGGFPKGDVNTKGNLTGYTKMLIENESSELMDVATADFNPSSSKNTISLLNEIGFNQRDWKIELYSGGTKSGGVWSGGVLRDSYNGSATNC